MEKIKKIRGKEKVNPNKLKSNNLLGKINKIKNIADVKEVLKELI